MASPKRPASEASPAPSSPQDPTIKTEPLDDSVLSKVQDTEIIDLISDEEDNEPTRPLLKLPPKEQIAPVNLGSSLLKKPKATQPNDKECKQKLLGEKLKQMQRNAAKSMREPQQPKHQPDASSLFVPDNNNVSPDAADPAEAFQALKRTVEEKSLAGTLSVDEEETFIQAEFAEKMRLLKSRSAGAEMEIAAADTRSINMSNADPGESSVDEDAPPGFRAGQKRKAPATSRTQPKKRGRPLKQKALEQPEETNGILQHFRGAQDGGRKGTAGTKGKGRAKDASKPKDTTTLKKRQSKPKYTGPTMMNASSMNNVNVVNDAAQTRDLAAPPTFDSSTTTRPAALKQLLASVPQENRHIAAVDKRYFENQLKVFTGQRSVGPAADGNWEMKGLRVTLKPYQVLGAAFMRQRENAKDESKGGILADQMGLGKTITTLAAIVNGKPLEESKCRTTLIVASAALVSQWAQEIADKVCTRRESKTFGINRVLEYHSSAKIKGNQEMEMLTECDIVITTYTQVAKSYPRADIPSKYVTAEQKLEWWNEYYENHRGPLHRVKWHRVVLDEAQAIKNHQSLTSRACTALDALHHWSISGTIVLNTPKEFYSQFKFLKVPHTESFKLFKENYYAGADDPDGLDRLKMRLSQFMIRRTHGDVLFNARLLVLPAPNQGTTWLEFNEIERAVYETVKARFISRINCISRAGDLDKSYSFIWTMLLRLRQLCSHVLLVQRSLVDLLEREDFEKLRTISSVDLSDDSESLLQYLHQKMSTDANMERNNSKDDMIVTESETAPVDKFVFDGAHVDLGGTHGLTYNFSRYLDGLRDSDAYEEICRRTRCAGCKQPPFDPMVTSCHHVYCRRCLNDIELSSNRRGREQGRCTECGMIYHETKPCEEIICEYAPDQDTQTGGSESASVGGSANGRSTRKKKEPESWLLMRGDVLPSAKTVALKAQVMAWIAEDPSVKIIVYSQFIPMIELLYRICQTEEWKAEKYTGRMSHDAREKALVNFGDPEKDVRILLASLKCGGIGLNLTMASRVICLDPWWNSSIEQQAFCRVYRIGQEKETQMTRLVVKNTIDEAILALQDSKQISIDDAMDESKRKEKVSTNELIRLFGKVIADEKGRPFIFAHRDDDGEDGESAAPRPQPAPEHESDAEGDGIVDDH